MTYTCPKDPTHASDDPDYCSICGAKIGAAPSIIDTPMASQPSGGAPASGDACPDCGTPRHPGARFCEICRYNYETRSSGSVAAVTTCPDPAPVSATAPSVAVQALPPNVTTAPAMPPADGPSVLRWEAVSRVDISLYVDPDPAVPCPVDEPERHFPLDLAENLIGRRSDRLDIHPEIPLTDPGVSHRHAKLYRQPDGGLVLLDVGSTNGTQVNGTDLAVGDRKTLNSGDEITVGCWTRITVTSVSQP